MINEKDFTLSVNKFLKNNLPVGTHIVEFYDMELKRAELEAGLPIIAFTRTNDLEDSVNHPRFNFYIYIIMKKSINSTLTVADYLSKIRQVMLDGTSFPLIDFNTNTVLTDCVIIKSRVQPSYEDGDRNLIRPVTFMLGYGNVFN
jgi:hypothetical protein